MGIPKFFRWISERYPMSSQLIAENRIPEFDNMYLDMNGIIHNCSHNNNESAHFRITEEQIWVGIFNYVDHLFSKIKPKKVFFLAIDGVAPRAKMNQQRSRRFRTAKDAEDTRQRALNKGEQLPAEDPFDSNCITPGTDFMKKLTLQLRYFINKKVSEDSNWQNVEIILSGPEVPGEGEHKIMEYIRLSKAQPGYNPNTRHCLYGLDADLIMLGLVSHDPHFALLREEVLFGRQNKKKVTLDSMNFYLMHHSLIREYLDMEFESLKKSMEFPYDLERIIDDFVLIALFIGNDFLPHLPSLHINEGALSLMFDIYKRVLPTCGGYIQDSGRVNMKRLQVILAELADELEKTAFQADCVNGLYLGGKKEDGQYERQALHKMERRKNKKTMTITPAQKTIFESVKEFALKHKPGEKLRLDLQLKNADETFIATLCRDLGFVFAVNPKKDNIKEVVIEFCDDDESETEVENWDEEAIIARDRVLNKYEKASVISNPEEEELAEKQRKERYDAGFKEWKARYYKEKMNIDYDNKEEMDGIIGSYIKGIQWVLHYYYSGVASWGWFYPYHYAPRISDLLDIEKYQDIEFDLGTPFNPFEQLMGVLPTLSKKLLPEPYQELMSNPNSPIIDFYPSDFDMDMNGKKQDWEAVIKIPFIDEKRLLEAMHARQHRLTKAEVAKSKAGQSFKFVFDNSNGADDEVKTYPSPLPGVFPDIHNLLAREVVYNLPSIEGKTLNKGLPDGVFLGKEALAGFPSLQTIPHTSELEACGVMVFQQPSRNESIVINLKNKYKETNAEDIANLLLYKRVFVNYPYLQEAVVIGVSNINTKYYIKFSGKKKQMLEHTHTPAEKESWRKRIGAIDYMSKKRFALNIGNVDIAIHVCVIRGMKRTTNGSYVKEYMNPAQEDLVPVQMCVTKVANEDARYIETPPLPITEEFPINSKVFFLGGLYYGTLGTVIGHVDSDTVDIQLVAPVNPRDSYEPNFGSLVLKEQEARVSYIPSFELSSRFKLANITLSKITSSVLVSDKGKNTNVGLSLKFEFKQQKVLGYSRKGANGSWEFSDKAVELIEEYIKRFPEFVSAIGSQNSSSFMSLDDFKWSPNPSAELQKMKEWLASKGVNDLPRASLTSEQFEEPYIQTIEQLGASYHKNYENLDFKKVIIKRIPRDVLLRPCDAESKLADQFFRIGNRVVYALDTGSIPLGTKGTVVGVHDNMIDIIFDVPFMGGHTLGGRCSEFRGATLSPKSVLSLFNKAAYLNKNPSHKKHVN
ncbi:XRN 5'-3' exonuclease N-terminus-domain-containing protein [Phycomyces nitens]|nr:XRN 5'-3' exonuclease N-terminus-domain-containing protein [Phycomyces nitens]